MSVGQVELVLDLSDDLLEDVLERDQPGGAPVLVGDHCDLVMPFRIPRSSAPRSLVAEQVTDQRLADRAREDAERRDADLDGGDDADGVVHKAQRRLRARFPVPPTAGSVLGAP